MAPMLMTTIARPLFQSPMNQSISIGSTLYSLTATVEGQASLVLTDDSNRYWWLVPLFVQLAQFYRFC